MATSWMLLTLIVPDGRCYILCARYIPYRHLSSAPFDSFSGNIDIGFDIDHPMGQINTADNFSSCEEL